MSGHSKWSKIKRQKGANDEARGKIFTKLSRNITLAAQQGGGDPDMNFSLRVAIDNAKSENLPSDKIERAIKRGTGELEGGQIVSIMYEGYGPGSVAILVVCQTDNTNRSLTEVKTITSTNGGKLSPEGSVSWQFTERGYFLIKPEKFQDSGKFGKEGEYKPVDPEELELELMEIPGVVDIKTEENEGEYIIEMISERDSFSTVHKQLEDSGFKVEEATLGWIANDKQHISEEDQEKLDKLVELLEESDEVNNVWHNAA